MSSFTQRLSSALQSSQPQQQSTATQQQQQQSSTGEATGKQTTRKQAPSILERPLLSGLLSSRKTTEAIPQVRLHMALFT
jgi:hypothetical protein